MLNIQLNPSRDMLALMPILSASETPFRLDEYYLLEIS